MKVQLNCQPIRQAKPLSKLALKPRIKSTPIKKTLFK